MLEFNRSKTAIEDSAAIYKSKKLFQQWGNLPVKASFLQFLNQLKSSMYWLSLIDASFA